MPNIDERLTTYLDKCRKIIGLWNARDISPNRFGVAATIVEPLFEQLGFDMLDGREITRGEVCEDPSRYFYGIHVNGEVPDALIEVRAFRDDTDDLALFEGAMIAAMRAGTDWLFVTNGRDWRLDNVRHGDMVTPRELRRISICNEAASRKTIDALRLLSRAGLRGSSLDERMRAERLRVAVSGVLADFDGERDLVRLLRARVQKKAGWNVVSAADVRQAIDAMSCRLRLIAEPIYGEEAFETE